jgi:hypothetical protein
MNTTTALEILKGRMDRAGVTCPAALVTYWQQRLDSAVSELQAKGIELTESVEDSALVADMAAESLLNRDKPGGRPDWLRLAIRERWLRERNDED